MNGTGGVDASQPTTFHRAAIQGSTYTDNVCYGWGDCKTAGGAATISPDFGIASVTHTAGSGSYTITLNTTNPDRNAIGINGVAVVTLKTSGLLFLTTSSVAGGSFTVSISQLYLGPPPLEGGCCPLMTMPTDADFSFVVFGR